MSTDTDPNAKLAPLDLSKFTGHEKLEVRLWILSPWRHDGRIFATNGHVLVSIDDDGREGVAAYKAGRHPNAHKLLELAPGAEFVSLPNLGPVTAPCKRCDGAGFHFLVDCEHCHGHGDFEHGRHTYKCAECDGDGQVGSATEKTRCETCAGFGESGWWQECDKTDIGEARFQTRYLRLFAGLPNVQIATGGPDARAVLKFDGGMGCVMPMRKQ